MDKGLCNNYLGEGGGVGIPEGGGIGEITTKERGLNVKFYTFGGGALLFSFPLINRKKGRRTIRV